MANARDQEAVVMTAFLWLQFLICAITEHKTSEATPFN